MPRLLGQAWPACYSGYLGCNAHVLDVINKQILLGASSYVCDELVPGQNVQAVAQPSSLPNGCASHLQPLNAHTTQMYLDAGYPQTIDITSPIVSCAGGSAPRFLFVGQRCDEVQGLLERGAMKTCTCEHGQPAAGRACTSDGPRCQSCDPGHMLSAESTSCDAPPPPPPPPTSPPRPPGAHADNTFRYVLMVAATVALALGLRGRKRFRTCWQKHEQTALLEGTEPP